MSITVIIIILQNLSESDLDSLLPYLNSEQLYNDLRYGRIDLIFINSTVVINTNKYKTFKLIDIEDCFFTTPEYYKKIFEGERHGEPKGL